MRRADWAEQLASFEDARRAMPFVWGKNDCVTFAMDAVRAMTDADPIADLRGRWATALGATRLLNKLGGIEAAATARFGAPKAPKFAQRGDVVLVRTAGRDSLAVCTGVLAIGAGVESLERVPMTEARMAWTV